MNRNSHNLRGSSVNPTPRWRIVFIALVLALVIGSVSPMPTVQAAPAGKVVYLSMKVQNPKITLRCGETVTYSVQVVVQDWEEVPPENAVPLPLGSSQIGLGVVYVEIEASSTDKSVGDFVGRSTARTQLFFDDLVVSLGAKFKFKANKPGKTTLYFEGLVGKEYLSTKLDVKVLPCKFKVTTIGKWHVPGPANMSIVAISDDAEVKAADAQTALTGSTTVNWVVTSDQVLDCIPQSSTASSKVDWVGNMDENGQLVMDAKYETAAMSLPVFCVGSDGGIASGSYPVQLTPDPLQVSVASSARVFRQSQVLQGPEATSGFVTIIVVPDEDEAAAFIPGGNQEVRWGDFSSLLGTLLALP